MKKLALALTILFTLNLYAFEVKVGDVLLQPRDCWSCTLIEEQEGSIYSHMGIVVQTEPQLLVAEALGNVRVLSYEKFNAGTQKNQKISVRRYTNEKLSQFFVDNKESFLAFFIENFSGLEYDHDFLWSNLDAQGNEKLYCSEMVTKFLKAFAGVDFPVKRMKFDKNREQWERYFRTLPPDGKWGNAPADFEKSEMFYEVGEL